jgi:hypothetical protein
MVIEARGTGFGWRCDHAPSVVEIFHTVRQYPYASTGRRTAADVVRDGKGACTGKHLLLVELLKSAGIPAAMATVFGQFGADLPPSIPGMPAQLQAMIRGGGAADYHHYVIATIGGRSVALDATWHNALVPYGFPVNADWDGRGDTVLALRGERIETDPGDLPAFKAALIAKLPRADRERREAFLRLLSQWIAGL